MDEIEQYLLIVKRHWLSASTVFLAVLAMTTFVTLRQKPIYQAKGQILTKKTNSTASLLGPAAGRGQDLLSTATQVELMRSRAVAKETIEVLKLNSAPEKIQASLTVTPPKMTEIIEVSYQDGDPDRAAKILNTVMSIYVKNDLDYQRSEARAARLFVEQQLPQIESEMRQAEKNFRIFKEQYQIVNLEQESQAAASSLMNVQTEMNSAYASLRSLTARSSELQQILGSDSNSALKSGIVSESPGLQKALADLREIQQKLALERTTFQEEHPTIADLKAKEAATQEIVQNLMNPNAVRYGISPDAIADMPNAGIQQSLVQDFARSEAERTSLQNQIAALGQAETYYRQRVNILPQLEQYQRELDRQVRTAQSTYELLVTKLQEARLKENQTIGNSQILTSALVPKSPIAPKKSQNILMGGIFGMLLGIGTAFLLEATDKSIKNPEDAKELFGYPVLGIIPAFEKVEKASKLLGKEKSKISQLIVRNAPSSPVSEAFRMLQTNLRFMGLDTQLKVIVVSSSVPGEGKSTTSANLATAIAQLGRRVLIIDGDMRKSSQQKLWEIPNEVGLSSVLTGQCEFHEAAIEVMKNLDVLPAGVTPPNPVMLLDSTQMAVLVAQCSKSYDVVIIDSPPLTVAADTTILCKIANGLVFVVRPGVANVGSVSYCKELLEQSSQNVLGMVVNGVSQSNGNYYHYYKYYGRKTEGSSANPSSNSVRG